MSSTLLSVVVFACVFGAAITGMLLRRLLPEHHFSPETKDTVKLSMGFVATMSALILGLLVASAKESYDKQSSGVTQMAAKVVYLDRLLANFGPETKEIRSLYLHVVEQVTRRMWPDGDADESILDPSTHRSEELLASIESLKPQTELQTILKSQAVSTCLELGHLRWLEYEQSISTSNPMLYILIFWTAVLFASFGIFAPTNGTVLASLALASLSVAGAIFLILELRSPFVGFLQIPQAAFQNAIEHLGK